jgi:hypothetical protein
MIVRDLTSSGWIGWRVRIENQPMLNNAIAIIIAFDHGQQ